jgi:hypothetical protein
MIIIKTNIKSSQNKVWYIIIMAIKRYRITIFIQKKILSIKTIIKV